MDYNQLFEQIKAKKSFLCVGLDSDIAKIPRICYSWKILFLNLIKPLSMRRPRWLSPINPISLFMKAGVSKDGKVWRRLYTISGRVTRIFLLLRMLSGGDIGNTSQMYAKAFLETLAFDSITVAPYMGEDSVTPFLQYEGKWVVLLALTSNKGAYDFQFFESEGDEIV